MPSCAQPATLVAACPGNLSELVFESAIIATSIFEGVPLDSQVGAVCVLDVERGITVPRCEVRKIGALGQLCQAHALGEKRPYLPVERRSSLGGAQAYLKGDETELLGGGKSLPILIVLP